MTREEQIKQAAKGYAADNPDQVQALIEQVGFEMGAEWADAHPNIDMVVELRKKDIGEVASVYEEWHNARLREMIEEACEWLDTELPRYVMEGREGKPYISVALVDDFKQAMHKTMKGGEE